MRRRPDRTQRVGDVGEHQAGIGIGLEPGHQWSDRRRRARADRPERLGRAGAHILRLVIQRQTEAGHGGQGGRPQSPQGNRRKGANPGTGIIEGADQLRHGRDRLGPDLREGPSRRSPLGFIARRQRPDQFGHGRPRVLAK